MKLLIIFLLFISSTARSSTEYRWITIAKKGKCYEVDSKTQGKRFIQKVENEKCKPGNTAYYFNYDKGHCFEKSVDNESTGYSKKVKVDFCKNDKTIYYLGVINNKYNCYEIDAATQGKAYFKRVNKKFCEKKNAEYFWKSNGDFSGECVSQNLSGEYKKVKTTLCRPTKVNYLFNRNDIYKGKCFEVHPEGANKYAKTVPDEKCLPDNLGYVFVKKKNKLRGTCYEIDADLPQKGYISKVKAEKCKQ